MTSTPTDYNGSDLSPAELELLARRRADADAHTTDQPTACRLCGVAVPARGARYVERWRQCAKCPSTGPRVLAQLLDLLDATDADVRAAGLPLFAAMPRALATNSGNRRRWEHVTNDWRAEALAQVRHHRAERASGVNDTGRGCGWCGVSQSRVWSSNFRAAWPDGVAVALCQGCTDGYVMAGQPPANGPDWRRLAAHLAIGGRVGVAPAEDTRGWRAYYESAAQDRTGTGQRWEYLPPAWRHEAQVWVLGQRPSAAADPEVGTAARAEFLRRVAEHHARLDQHAAAERQGEAWR